MNILIYFHVLVPNMEKEINLKLIQKVEQNGRITFPAKERERYGLKAGDYVEITIHKVIRYSEVL